MAASTLPLRLPPLARFGGRRSGERRRGVDDDGAGAAQPRDCGVGRIGRPAGRRRTG